MPLSPRLHLLHPARFPNVNFYCLLAIILLIAISQSSWALGEKSWLTKSAGNSLVLVDKKNAAELIIDANEFPGVIRATKNLQTDIENVTGKTPALHDRISEQTNQVVIIGTLGKSKVIDQLITNKKLDVSKIQNQWDAFHVQVVEQPFPHVKRALVIVGANKRGTMYGIYSLSEQIGDRPGTGGQMCL